jgi:hypothetical protein
MSAGYQFSQRDAERIAQAVRAWERGPRNSPTIPRRGRYQGVSFRDGRVAIAPGGGIPARSGLVCGHATCDLYNGFDADTATLSDTTSETVFNPMKSAVAASADIFVVPGYGVWWVVCELCPP